jgi:hypothetical protein
MTERQLAEITAAEQAPIPLAFIARDGARSDAPPNLSTSTGSREQG